MLFNFIFPQTCWILSANDYRNPIILQQTVRVNEFGGKHNSIMNGDPFWGAFYMQVHNSTLLYAVAQKAGCQAQYLSSFCSYQWKLWEKHAALWELLAETLWECDWSDLVKMSIVSALVVTLL